MNKLFVLLLNLTFLGLQYSFSYAEQNSTPKEKLTHSWQKVDFQLLLNSHLSANKKYEPSGNPPQSNDTRSIAKAALFSVAIPGLGQAYNRSYLKSIAFLAVEASAIFGYFHFNNRGNDLETRYTADADRFWNEDAYWNWISTISGIDPNNLEVLREYERNTFSHFLPQEKNQQYYENIGKYDQFIIGWKDFRTDMLNDDIAKFTFEHYKSGSYNGLDLTTISSERNGYVDLRKDSNNNFKRATNMVTLVLFNHVLSALDAAWTTKRHNQRIISASLRMKYMKYGTEIIPALALGVAW